MVRKGQNLVPVKQPTPALPDRVAPSFPGAWGRNALLRFAAAAQIASVPGRRRRRRWPQRSVRRPRRNPASTAATSAPRDAARGPTPSTPPRRTPISSTAALRQRKQRPSELHGEAILILHAKCTEFLDFPHNVPQAKGEGSVAERSKALV